MPNNENVITTVFKADINNFSQNTQQLNRYISTVNSEFKAAVAGLGDWSKSQDGLSAKITQLNKILDAENRKLGSLESAYDDLVAAGKENTAEAQKLAIAINNQRAKVAQTERDIGKYTDSLNELKDAGVETKDELDALNRELAENAKEAAKAAKEAEKAAGSLENLNTSVADNGKEATATAGKFGGLMKGLAGIGAAAVGVVASFVGLAESTREYRTEMAKLETAFSESEHSAAAAEKTYKDLYGVLGDEGRATEAAQQLAEFAQNEDDLAKSTRILTGVWGKYGDSIPTEGLAEGMAATAAMGEVQGVLADALEWQGVNLEEYNAQLAELSTKEERAAFIQETLTDLYGDAADAYAENNKEIIAANKAQAELTDATAELGAAAEPLNTIFKGIAATLITGLLPYIKGLAEGLQKLFSGDFAGGAEQIGGVFDSIVLKLGDIGGKIITKIGELLPQIVPKLVEMLSGLIQKLVEFTPSIISAALTLFNGIVQALPPTLTALLAELPKILDTVLSALSAALPLILAGAQKAFMAIVQALPSVLSALVAALPKILQSVIDFLVTSAPKLLSQAIGFLMEIVRAIPSIVSSLASNLPKIVTSITSTLASNAPRILSAAVSMLKNIVSAIPQIARELLGNMPQIISSIVSGLAGGYKALFDIGKDMLKGLWAGMESLGSWIWKKIKGFFNDTLVGGIKKLLGIASPSKVFAEMGEYSAEGYINGFTGVMNNANSTLARVNYAGAVGVGSNPAGQGVQHIGGNTYNVYQTFEKMETTRYALHRAKVETLNALKLSEA